MSGDVGDYWREAKEHQRDMKALLVRLGSACVTCEARAASLHERDQVPKLLPAQKCPACGNRDPRKRNRKKRNRSRPSL